MTPRRAERAADAIASRCGLGVPGARVVRFTKMTKFALTALPALIGVVALFGTTAVAPAQDKAIVVATFPRETRTRLRSTVAEDPRHLLRVLDDGGVFVLVEREDGVLVLHQGTRKRPRTTLLTAPEHEGEAARLSTLDVVEGAAVATWIVERSSTTYVWVDRVRRQEGVLHQTRQSVLVAGPTSLAEAHPLLDLVVEASSHAVVSVGSVRSATRYDGPSSPTYDSGYLLAQRASIGAGTVSTEFTPPVKLFGPRGERIGVFGSIEHFHAVQVEPRTPSAWIGARLFRGDSPHESGVGLAWVGQLTPAGDVGHNGTVSGSSLYPDSRVWLDIQPLRDDDAVGFAAIVETGFGIFGGDALTGRVPQLPTTSAEPLRLRDLTPAPPDRLAVAHDEFGNHAAAWRPSQLLSSRVWFPLAGRVVARLHLADGRLRHARNVLPRSTRGRPAIAAVKNHRERFIVASARGARDVGPVTSIVLRGVDLRGRLRRRQSVAALGGEVLALAECHGDDADGRVWMLWSALDDRRRRTLRLSRLLRPPPVSRVRARKIEDLFGLDGR